MNAKDNLNKDKGLTSEQVGELVTNLYHSTESIVAFIDILGFGDLVLSLESNSSVASADHAFKAVSRLFQISDFFGRDGNFGQVESSIFSDTIVFSRLLFPSTTNIDLVNFFHSVSETQSLLLHQGYLTRGGIAVGKCIHKKNHVLFGKAIIDAYRLEQEAKYPRVIISSSARKRMEQLESANLDTGLQKFTIPERYLRQDLDGMHFVDYLRVTTDFQWEKLRTTITSGLEKYRDDASRYSKYYWLAFYYNHACDFWIERFHVEKISLEKFG